MFAIANLPSVALLNSRRGLTPPHRVKSISMATFSQEEIEFVKSHGNDECAKTWLGLWDISDPKQRASKQQSQDHRELMVDKYERKRYYLEPASPLKSIAAASGTSTTVTASNMSSSTGSSSGSSGSFSSGGIIGAVSSNSSGSSPQSQKMDNNLAALKAITLTPPTRNASSRISTHSQHPRSQVQINNNHLNNNLNHQNSSVSNSGNSFSASSIGGVNGGISFHHQPFSSVDNSLFNPQPAPAQSQQQQQNHHQNRSSSNQNLVNNNNNNIIANGNSGVNNSNSFTMPTTATTMNGTNKNRRHNGFSDSNGNHMDFVADFGAAADIFNTPNNNYQNGGFLVNGKNGGIVNGGGGAGVVAGNGVATENFADFDHNPIFNAAGEFETGEGMEESECLVVVAKRIGQSDRKSRAVRS